MDERFHEGLSHEALRALGARRDGPGLTLLAAQVALGLVSAGALVRARTPTEWTAGLVLQALVQVSMFATLHECVHRTAFRTDALNQLGAWLASLCQLMAPPLMRELHFAHHRHTHELASDPELAGMARMAAWPRGLDWLATASGLPILLARVAFTLVTALGGARLLPFVREGQRARVALASSALLLAHAGLIALALRLEPRLLHVYLAVPLAHALLSLYVTCEHRGLPMTGSILERTRSFDPGPVARWWMWNMPFHAEHHAYPAVPFHALPALHGALRPQLAHRVGGVLELHLRGGRE
jgi:fatty acid desaturase